MSKITDLIDDLNVLETTQTQLAQQIADTREGIMQELRSEGLTQIKTPYETVSIAKRVSLQVNEIEWRAWAQKQPDVELDMFYVQSLDKKLVTAHAEKMLKDNGEIVPGITPNETEYLSIRKAKDAK